MDYKLIRSFLFQLNPELSHTLTLTMLKLLHRFGRLTDLLPDQIPSAPKKILGLTFDNPVGLAAGLDKNGDYLDALAALGFGFIEVGTVTPKPQRGNAKPRLFRLTQQQAIINRMGFNNKGVDYLVNKINTKKYQGILGVNIGKNATTPLEKALEDYHYCLTKVYAGASYITINISSPNTPGLRHLQEEHYLNKLLAPLKQQQLNLAQHYQCYKPLLLKIAPDLDQEQIVNIAAAVIANDIDGIIATNTTMARHMLSNSRFSQEAGGLSGQPLFESATLTLKHLKAALGHHNIPIIASGGIMSGDQAGAKIRAGADLIQLYTGLIYKGPKLIADSIKCIIS